MPHAATWSVNDINQFGAVIRPMNDSATLLARGPFAACVTQINLHRVWTQHFQESSARLWYPQTRINRTAIEFLTRAGYSISWRGADVAADEVTWHGSGPGGWHRTSGATSWGSMSLPDEDWAKLSDVVAGLDLNRASLLNLL